MATQQIRVPGDVAIKVAIGEVCFQWAQLEMALLGIICQIEPMELDKGYIIFGGLDILPRANMAINLARYNKLPVSLTKRIVAVRKRLQDDLSERRNRVVHGAHRDTEGATTTLTMPRWKGDKQNARLDASEIAQVGHAIYETAMEAWSIMHDILERSVRIHAQENLSDAL